MLRADQTVRFETRSCSAHLGKLDESTKLDVVVGNLPGIRYDPAMAKVQRLHQTSLRADRGGYFLSGYWRVRMV
jgi:hypothetical protein